MFFLKFVKEQLSCSHMNQECHNLLLYMFTACLYRGGIFESHVYMLLKIPAHISYRLCCVRSTQLQEAFHDIIKSYLSVQVKMLICRTVLCVAYQIRAPLRAFGR